ncbi:zinc finger protein 252-like isoform X2 [Limulus polyphemus]|nr:zinc finger protein 252-like isoform X2 [Limulus polyphemus]
MTEISSAESQQQTLCSTTAKNGVIFSPVILVPSPSHLVKSPLGAGIQYVVTSNPDDVLEFKTENESTMMKDSQSYTDVKHHSTHIFQTPDEALELDDHMVSVREITKASSPTELFAIQESNNMHPDLKKDVSLSRFHISIEKTINLRKDQSINVNLERLCDSPFLHSNSFPCVSGNVSTGVVGGESEKCQGLGHISEEGEQYLVSSLSDHTVSLCSRSKVLDLSRTFSNEQSLKVTKEYENETSKEFSHDDNTLERKSYDCLKLFDTNTTKEDLMVASSEKEHYHHVESENNEIDQSTVMPICKIIEVENQNAVESVEKVTSSGNANVRMNSTSVSEVTLPFNIIGSSLFPLLPTEAVLLHNFAVIPETATSFELEIKSDEEILKKFHMNPKLRSSTLEMVHECSPQQDSVKSFENSPSLKSTSINDDTSVGSERPFQCELCSASFSRMGNYTRHKKIHAVPTKKDHRFHCSVCEKSFIQKCDLTRHMHIHSGTEPHRCSQCGKGYIRHSDLVTHQRFHNKEKPFICSHCHKGFSQRGDLNRHLRSIHLQTKPLTCGHCNRKFVKEATLIRHMQITHRCLILESIKDRTAEEDNAAINQSCSGLKVNIPNIEQPLQQGPQCIEKITVSLCS